MDQFQLRGVILGGPVEQCESDFSRASDKISTDVLIDFELKSEQMFYDLRWISMARRSGQKIETSDLNSDSVTSKGG